MITFSVSRAISTQVGTGKAAGNNLLSTNQATGFGGGLARGEHWEGDSPYIHVDSGRTGITCEWGSPPLKASNLDVVP